MVIPKEILSDYKEIYERAIKQVNEESKNDPPTEPFRSHEAAKDLLLQMKEKLKVALVSVQAEEADDGLDDFTYTVLQAFVCRDLGRIYVFTEEPQKGESLLLECLELIKDRKMEPQAVIPYVGAMIELGIVYANRTEYKKSFDMLKEAEAAYNKFRTESKHNPMAITDVFGTPDEVEKDKGLAELESLYTLCTFYMAQVYGHLGELEKSAQYCHRTLRRQVEAKTYEPIDFALNSATLSQYFIGQNMFKQARHHLAASTLVMSEYEATMLTPNLTEEQKTDLQETFKHRFADVARCWAKYGLALLSASKDRLYNDDEEKLAEDARRLKLDATAYLFPNMELSAYEDRISCDYCLTFEDAKEVYHFVTKWLDIAKDHYKPDTDATEYAKIIKDFAELYQHVAFFEEDPSNQSKMQKRRAKYYEDLLELLNPVFYMVICRECWYGAGLSYCAILDIKLDCLKANRTPNPQELGKINQVCQQAIKNFKSFIDSYTEKDGAWKPNMDVETQKTVLYAHFHLGRLFFKMITPDHNLQLDNLSNSLKYYKIFTEECNKMEQAGKALQAEVGVCREMINLLPLKIASVKKRIGN